MKLCKDCEHFKPNRFAIDILKDRHYSCSKHRVGVILKRPEDVETLKCVEWGNGDESKDMPKG